MEWIVQHLRSGPLLPCAFRKWEVMARCFQKALAPERQLVLISCRGLHECSTLLNGVGDFMENSLSEVWPMSYDWTKVLEGAGMWSCLGPKICQKKRRTGAFGLGAITHAYHISIYGYMCICYIHICSMHIYVAETIVQLVIAIFSAAVFVNLYVNTFPCGPWSMVAKHDCIFFGNQFFFCSRHVSKCACGFCCNPTWRYVQEPHVLNLEQVWSTIDPYGCWGWSR